MTEQEKDLLLKELSARYPYGVKVWVLNTGGLPLGEQKSRISHIDGVNNGEAIIHGGNVSLEGHHFQNYPVNVKPYLRSLPSMTEEERAELSDYLCEQVMSSKTGITIPPDPIHGKGIPFGYMQDCINWLLGRHFDFNGLIEKGLALEAPEGMYEI